jgi:hypothetical protein
LLIDDHDAVAATVVGSSHNGPHDVSLLLSLTSLAFNREESCQRVVGDSVFYLYLSTPSFVVSTVEPFRCSDLYGLIKVYIISRCALPIAK